MRKPLVVGIATMLVAGALLAGCTSTATNETEITSAADIPELAVSDGWENVKASYAELDSEAQVAFDEINSSNVREKVLEYCNIIVENSPTVLEAAKSGEVSSDAEAAAEEIYKAAYVLDALGEESAQDVSLYIQDISVDAMYLLSDTYDNQPAGAEARKSECDVNLDRILSFTDDEWDAYASTL